MGMNETRVLTVLSCLAQSDGFQEIRVAASCHLTQAHCDLRLSHSARSMRSRLHFHFFSGRWFLAE